MNIYNMFFADPYESRKIDRWENEDGDQFISTAEVNDGGHPYETAFCHPDYNNGKMVIVEAYDSIDDAKSGHKKWVKIITGKLPSKIVDCRNSEISKILDAYGGDRIFKRNKTRTNGINH